MQRLPPERRQRVARAFAQPDRLGLEAGGIGFVAHDRVADMGEVDADLVGAAGFEHAGEQAGDWLAVEPAIGLAQLPMRHCRPAALAHGAFLAVERAAVERGVNHALRAAGCAPGEREIAALQFAGELVGELLRQRAVGTIVLGDHHQPGGVLVEAVDDARPLDAADTGKTFAAMRDQRVDQRAGGMSGGRVDDQAARLVDDDQVVVFVDDVQRDRFA